MPMQCCCDNASTTKITMKMERLELLKSSISVQFELKRYVDKDLVVQFKVLLMGEFFFGYVLNLNWTALWGIYPE